MSETYTGIYTGMNKGGRGKTNPWQSVTVRLPVPLLETVEKLKRDFIVSQELPLLSPNNQPSLPDKTELIALATKCLARKKSARATLSVFLSELYGETIKL
jgi:hypothetical protein